jgi:hypothetical protein
VFNRRKEREATEIAEAAADRSEMLRRYIEDAQTFDGVDAADVPDMRLRTNVGERVFLCVHGAVLIEPRREVGPDDPGERLPHTVDRGEFVVTDQRAMFTGAKQIRQWAWSYLVGVEHGDNAPWTWIDVSNRRKSFGVLYDYEHQEEMQFSIELAAARVQGTRQALVDRLADELRAIESEIAQTERARQSV